MHHSQDICFVDFYDVNFAAAAISAIEQNTKLVVRVEFAKHEMGSPTRRSRSLSPTIQIKQNK